MLKIFLFPFKAQFLILFLVLLASTEKVIAQNEVIDDLISSLKDAKEDTNKVIILTDLCWEYTFIDPEKSIEYGGQGIILAKRLNYELGLQDAYRYSGRAHSYLGNYAEAIDLFENALSINKNDEQSIGLIHIDIGGMYESSGDNALALDHYYKAIRLFENIEFQQGVGVVKINIIDIYIFQKDYQKALKLSNEAIELFKALGDPISEGLGYFNKGAVLIDLKRYDEAYLALNHSLQIFEKYGALQHKSEAYTALGNLYQEKGELDKALELYNQSLAIDDSLGYQLYMAKSYSNIAGIYFAKGEFKMAVKYNELALKIAKESGDMQWFMTTMGYMADNYYGNGQYDLAYEYRLFYDQIKDSLYSENQSNQIIAITEKYNLEKKDQEIIQLKLNEAATEHESNLYYTIAAVSFVTLIIGLFALVLYSRNQNSKNEIVQNQLEQKVLRSQMNPHFIFNSLNSIQRLYIEGEEDIANDYMADFSNLLRRILENSSMDKVSLKEELRSTILYLDLEKMRTDNLFTYEIEIDPNVDQLNTFVPPLILQPYLENAIWHGIMPKNEQGKITLRINTIEENDLRCIITDNGIGMKESLNQKSSTMWESKGMSITADRLGGENHVFISELESGGTEVKLRIRKIK
ncbi:MAG: tetratricopeptide (TPR) repeat protein [Crocinitomix sp.]|jgi:tetratricopeptide (TPR) repeat protein